MSSYPNPAQGGSQGGPDQLALARRYIARGWHPCPLEPNSKAIKRKGWQRADYTSRPQDHFCGGNIGVKLGNPSDGLVDIGLDCSEAHQLARSYLPRTGAIFGRKSAPQAHWLYVVGTPTPGTRQLKAGEEKYVELRGTGAQTMFPGSVHPSGEFVTWASEGEPARLDYEELLTAV
jgi:hypothetical protein